MSEQQSTDVVVDPMDDLDAFTSDFFGEKKGSAAKQSEVAQDKPDDKAETEDKEAQTTQLTDEDETEAEAELQKEEDAKPKKSKVQERIDELVKQREDEKRESKAREAAIRAEFEAKLEALKPKAQETKAAVAPTPDDLKEDGTPKYELGEYDPTYIRDLTKHTLESERAQAAIRDQEQRQMQEQQAQTAALTSSWNTKVEAAKEKYPDLVEKGTELLEGFKDLPEGYAGYLSTVLMSMDHGPDVLHYLAVNPAEARTIVNSGAQKATLALGRIEAKFIEAEAQKLVAKPKISNAPPPPAATARGSSGGTRTVPADTDDLDAFESAFFRRR